MMSTTHFHIALKLMSGNIPVLHLCAFMICTEPAFIFNIYI